MVRRNTWITLGVFAVVLAAGLLIRQRLSDSPPPTAAPSPQPLWRVDSSQIASLVVEDLKAGTVLQLERDEAELWRMERPQAGPADAARVERAVAWLAAPTPRAELADALDLAAFELAEPLFRVEIVLKTGERFEFSVGRTSPTGDSRYVSTPGRSGVQIMSLIGLDEVLNLAADLLPTATPEATLTPTEELTPSESPEPGATASPSPQSGETATGTPEAAEQATPTP